MNVKKYITRTPFPSFFPSHVVDILDPFGEFEDQYPWPVTDFTLTYKLYDPTTHDLVPKKEHKEKLAKEKDKELEELEKYYEQKKQKLLAEKERLTS